MRDVVYSTQAKKDLKRYRNNPPFIHALYEVLSYLVEDKCLPERFKAHHLVGKYRGCLECHIGNDFLLVWIDGNRSEINIVRLGSHSEIFR